MKEGTTLRRTGALVLVASILVVAVVGISCRDDRLTDDLDYLVWEVCRQVRTAGVTADEVSGILHDATRHGAVMDRIEDECGDDIASVFATTTTDPKPRD